MNFIDEPLPELPEWSEPLSPDDLLLMRRARQLPRLKPIMVWSYLRHKGHAGPTSAQPIHENPLEPPPPVETTVEYADFLQEIESIRAILSVDKEKDDEIFSGSLEMQV